MDYSKNSAAVAPPDMGEALLPVVQRIYRFAFSLTRDPERAQDLTQATYLRAMEKKHQFDWAGRLDSWCMAICRSIWLNEVRAAVVRQTAQLEDVPQDALRAHLPDADENIFAAEVLSEIMKLPEAQRVAVFLVYGEGYRYSEAAEILDVPIGTIMSRLPAARKRLEWLKETEHGGQKARGKEVMR